MIADIASFAHRKLTPLARFKTLGLPGAASVALPYPLDFIGIATDEQLLGVYENTFDSPDELIAVTDRCLYLACDSRNGPIPYSAMRSVTYAKFTPERDEHLVIVDFAFENAIRFYVRGSSAHEFENSTFDSYSFGMFLESAAGYARQNSG